MSLTKRGGLSRTPTKPTGKKQNDDLGVGAVGGIDRGAIPKSDFDKERKWEAGEVSKARNYEERRKFEMNNKQEKEETICRNNEKEVKSSHIGLQCDLCDHCSCEKVSTEDYKLLSRV